MIAYFDTSAFVKLIVEEAGSTHAAELWTRATQSVSSILLYPEGRAALRRAQRAGRLGPGSSRTAATSFDRLWRRCASIPVNLELALRAGELAHRYGLGGYDAVHLAAALALDVSDVVLVAADHDLCDAAAVCGLAVARV